MPPFARLSHLNRQLVESGIDSYRVHFHDTSTSINYIELDKPARECLSQFPRRKNIWIAIYHRAIILDGSLGKGGWDADGYTSLWAGYSKNLWGRPVYSSGRLPVNMMMMIPSIKVARNQSFEVALRLCQALILFYNLF